LELLDLRIFCDLVELQSFTGAAVKNCLTQSAVSQRIKRLDEYYGHKLFLNRKQLILSWHGKYVYDRFKDILKIHADTEEIIEKESIKDTLSIGFSENAKARYFSKDLFKEILTTHFLPELYFGPSRSIFEKVLFGSIDYGIIGNLPQATGGLATNELYKERIFLVSGNADAATHSLEGLPLIMDHRDSGLYQFLKNELAAHGKDIETLNIVGYVGTSADKIGILTSSNYCAFLPEVYISIHPQLRKIPLPFEFYRTFMEIYLKKNLSRIRPIGQLIRNLNVSED
jgi:DNA-binding transcriptional LysR family regulator